MADTAARRRGHDEDAIYFDAAKNRYAGAIATGFGPGGKRIRRKITGRTTTEVRDKLKAAHAELGRGLRTSGHLHGPARGGRLAGGRLAGPVGPDEVRLP